MLRSMHMYSDYTESAMGHMALGFQMGQAAALPLLAKVPALEAKIKLQSVPLCSTEPNMPTYIPVDSLQGVHSPRPLER